MIVDGDEKIVNMGQPYLAYGLTPVRDA